LARRTPALLLVAVLLAACGDDSGRAENFALSHAKPVSKPAFVQTLKAPSGSRPHYFESALATLATEESGDLALKCPDGMTAFDGYLAHVDPGVIMSYNGPRPHEPDIWQYGLSNLREQPAEYSVGIVCTHEG
jgi:hypothetical protein